MKNKCLFVCSASLIGLASMAQAELITGNIEIGIGSTFYDGKDLMISNGTVVVRGYHVFGTVSLVETSRLSTVWSSNVTSVVAMPALSIGGSSAMDLGGGTTLVVSNLMQLDPGAVVNAQAMNNTGTVGGQWLGVGPELEAGTLVLATNSVISADGQGYGSAGASYAAGAGPGGGLGGSYSGYGSGGGGGAYGGAGGNGRKGGGGAACGSAFQPVTLGSGGGTGVDGYAVRRGGGALKIVAGRLSLDGVIRASGQDGQNDVGGGSGGSLFLNIGTLEGAGLLQANGGVGGGTAGGGSGGRIAVYYGVATGFTAFAQCTAAGGAGYNASQAGSVGFFDTNFPGTRLSVFYSFNCTNPVQVAEAVIGGGQASRWSAGATLDRLELGGAASLLMSSNVAITTAQVNGTSQLRLEGGGVFTNLTLTSTGSVVLVGAQLLQAETVLLTNASSLLVEVKDNSGQVGGLWIATGGVVQAKSLLIATNCVLTADGQGYGSAGASYAAGAGPGGGAGGTYSAYGSGGGGGAYGGAGGSGRRGNGGAAYGSAFQPVTVGSGGGTGVDAYAQRRGGGAIQVVAGRLWLEGVIRANGQDGQNDVGGGSGGSLLLSVGALEGAGALQANGGVGGGTAGGGGGGRIAVYYGVATGFTAFARCTASGGVGWSSGEPGSVGFFDINLPNRVSVYYSFSSTDHVQLAEAVIRGGQTTRWSRGATIERLDISGSSAVRIGGEASLQLLSVSDGSSLQVTSNAWIISAQLLQGSQLRLDGGGVFSNLALVSTSSLTLAGAQLLRAGTLSLTNASSMLVESKDNAGQIGGQWVATGGVVRAKSLFIATNCVLAADGQGYGSAGASYAAGVGPGGGAGGAYSGYGSGGGGGGYGGVGGGGRKGGGGPAYGSRMNPTAVGSGGGTGIDAYAPRRGGGFLNVVADLLWLDGAIRANGQDGQNDVGGGSGGSLLLNIGSLEGAGSLQAKGGAGGGTAGGGGGGRIALFSGNSSNFTGFANCSVAGGPGWATGGTGSFIVNSTWESWVVHYWPLGGSGGPTNDFDGDGMTNEQEYWAGTDPTDRDSCLKLLALPASATPQGFVVLWTSLPDRFYAIDRATNWVPGAPFLNLQSSIPGAAGTTSFTDTTASGPGLILYRVRLQP